MPRLRDRVKTFLEGKSVIEWNGNKPGKWFWKDTGMMEVDGKYLLTKPEVRETLLKVREMRDKRSL